MSIMSNISKIILSKYVPDYKKLNSKIMEAEVVSFDIFDTLIKRNVMKPSDIHDLVAIELKRKKNILLKEYKRIRIKAENSARKKSESEEITLEQIYECMYEIDTSIKKELMRIEKNIEVEMSCPNIFFKQFYLYAIENKKKVIITSDMYLDEDVIKMILQKNNFLNYEKLYLSSTIKKTKHSGNLFEYILQDLKIKAEKVLHIGDNVKGDFLMPHRYGIKAFLIPNQTNYILFWKKSRNKNIQLQIQYSVVRAFLNNNLCKYQDKDFARSIGFEVLGPLLVGYTLWLNGKINSENPDKIFFLSREGNILQQAFSIINSKIDIPQSYLYVSRQAVCVPLLALANSFNEFIDNIKTFMRTPTLKTLCDICSLDENIVIQEVAKIGLSANVLLHDIDNTKRGKVFAIFKTLGEKKFTQQKEFLIKYLKSEKLCGNIILADVGWVGTMQNAIQHLAAYDESLHITGMYLGVRNLQIEKFYSHLNRMGYLFEPSQNSNYDYLIRFTTEIFETLFMNGDGSVKGYEELNNGEIKPVLSESEYTPDDALFINRLQNAALSFVDQCADNMDIFQRLSIAPDVWLCGYINFAGYPSMKTIKFFEKFSFRDEVVKPLIPEHSLLYYVFHLKAFKQDLSMYCKVFMLKKLFILPLPYHKILRFMMEKLHCESDYKKNYYKK